MAASDMRVATEQAYYALWQWAWALAPRGMAALQRADWMADLDDMHSAFSVAVRSLFCADFSGRLTLPPPPLAVQVVIRAYPRRCLR